VEARLTTARLLTQLGRYKEAVGAYQALAKRDPSNITALFELSWVQGRCQDFSSMLATVDRLESLDADPTRELDQVAIGYMHQCDWSRRHVLLERFIRRFSTGRPCLVNVMSTYAAVDDPEIHLLMSRCISSFVSKHTDRMQRPEIRTNARSRRSGPLRVGYLSGDFNDHVISLLIGGVIESHDRNRLEVLGYDYSEEDGSCARKRILAAFDRVTHLNGIKISQSAAIIAADEIDILVDLKGYTFGTRNEILALRPSAVQVNFLGHVGTQGSSWIDYVIADRHVLPLADQLYWSEQIVHMPNSYLPNDRSRPVPQPTTATRRSELGLPANGFVFACFNSSHTITPNFFAVWMRLLHAVPESVLWLVSDNDKVAFNLRREAGKAGVSSERLIFSCREPFESYIDRFAYADLFLDTQYNGHTTGADCLWAALPVVTVRGRSFACRVGASLLQAVGLPELICGSLEDYFQLALSLARCPSRLNALRSRLEIARKSSPLYDSKAFAADLEKAFYEMNRISQVGLKPGFIAV